MTAPNDPRPGWWTPGMPEAEVRIWEAAERAAASAPRLVPGDDVHMALRPLLRGFLTTGREERGAA